MKETQENDNSNGSANRELSLMNIITIIVMIAGFYATTASFRTHVSDFERQAKIEINDLKDNDQKLEERLRPVELESAKMSSELRFIHEGIDKINSKIDKIVNSQ